MSSTVGSKLTISKKKRENVQSTSNSSLGRQSSRTRKTINPPKRFRVEKVEHCDDKIRETEKRKKNKMKKNDDLACESDSKSSQTVESNAMITSQHGVKSFVDRALKICTAAQVRLSDLFLFTAADALPVNFEEEAKKALLKAAKKKDSRATLRFHMPNVVYEVFRDLYMNIDDDDKHHLWVFNSDGYIEKETIRFYLEEVQRKEVFNFLPFSFKSGELRLHEDRFETGKIAMSYFFFTGLLSISIPISFWNLNECVDRPLWPLRRSTHTDLESEDDSEVEEEHSIRNRKNNNENE